MNITPVRPHPEKPQAYDLYRRINDRLDQEVVPYLVNETSLAAYRDVLCREGNSAAACYWLLMARLAELALLCAGYYADCGEVTAAGDLLFNPRRIDIHVRGRHQPIVKDRHRPLSEQLNDGGVSHHEFINWFHHNAITRVMEPALIPDFLTRLTHSGWISEAFLDSYQARTAQVADAMRFGSCATGLSAAPGQPALRAGRSADGDFRQVPHCRFETTCYRRLAHDIEQIWHDTAYRSQYLGTVRHREIATAAASEEGRPGLREQLSV
ncbi:MAG: hypothetical protein V2I40_05380 [Desulfobacteraceae bacterium]|nr:hypothetical protein [Desulfobacteraceae bacterium]